MKRFISTFLLVFISSAIFGQIYFVPGYITDLENKKTECLIKFKDWEFTPQFFEYKLSEEGNIRQADLTSAKEVYILNSAKYISAKVSIDRSPSEISKLSKIKNPEWIEESLFLKVLVQGKASLYQYKEHNFIRYFYSIEDTIEQLVYKEFLINKNNQEYASVNTYFRQQLFNYVNCNNTETDLKNLEYDQKQLTKYFLDYNQCAGIQSSTFEKKKEKEKFNLRLSTGLDLTSVSIFSSISDAQDADFKRKMNIMAAIEAEYIIPFRKNKWSLLGEVSYHRYDSETLSLTGNTTIEYGAVDFSFGVRHYFFLNEKNKIFIDGFLNSVTAINLNSEIVLPNTTKIMEFKDNLNVAGGAGFAHGRISAEVRYYTTQNIFSHEVFSTWGSDLQKISLILAFKVD